MWARFSNSLTKYLLNNFGTKGNTILSLQSAFEKRHKFFKKNRNPTQQILKVFKKNLVVKIKALTFALPNKNGWSEKGQKIFESLEVTAQNFYNSTR